MSSRLTLTVAAVWLAGCTAHIDPEAATAMLLRIECSGEICERTEQLAVHVDTLSRDSDVPVITRVLHLDLSKITSWPIDVPVIPRDPRNLPDAFQASVEAFGRDDQKLADARAISYFERSVQRVLHLQLGRCGALPLGGCESDAHCVGTQCRTCVRARCESTPITDPRSLPVLTDEQGGIASIAIEHVEDAGTNKPNPPGLGTVARQPAAAASGSSASAASSGAADSDAGSASPSNSAPGVDAGAVPMQPAAKPSAALAWSDPSLLEDLPENVVMPAFASNHAGDLAVAWWQDSSEGYLWLQRFHHRVWESDALRVSGGDRPSMIWSAPNISIDGDGRAHMLTFIDVSTTMLPTRRMLWARWSGAEDIRVETPWLVGRAPLESVPLMLEVADDGHAVAMFSGPAIGPDGTSELFSSRYEEELWGTPVAVGQLAYAASDFPQSAGNGAGDYVSVFKLRSGDRVLGLSLFVSHAGEAPRDTKVMLPAPLVGSIHLAMDEQGNAGALFSLDEGGTPRAYWLRYVHDTQALSGPERVSPQALQVEGLALLPGGQPLGVWREASAGTSTNDTQLAMSRFTDGQGWSSNTAIGEPFAADSDDSVALTVSAHEEVLVVWTQRVDTKPEGVVREMFASHALGAGTFSPPALISTGADAYQLLGAAWDDVEHAVAVWVETNKQTKRRDLKWSCTR